MTDRTDDVADEDAEVAQTAALVATVAALFAGDISAAVSLGSRSSDPLHPLEAAQATGFGSKRRAEFTAGRSCAHRALRAFGVSDSAVPIGADRAPQWPAGYVGSITHTDGFAAAVVAAADRYRAIGIDAERIGRVTPELNALLFTSAEIAMLASLDDQTRARAATVVFSAKEAFYKCQYTLTRAWRDFTDVTIDVGGSGLLEGPFMLDAAATTTVTDWHMTLPRAGRYTIHGDIAITAFALEA